MTQQNLKTAYITTPIYYPTAKPHLGTAYTSIAADIYARFKRLDGFDTYFLTGTDEHGMKLQRKAEERGIPVQQHVDEVTEDFKALTPMLNLSNNRFIRTTDADHKKAAQALWLKMQENGFIYKDTYSGWYCVSDEAYYDESELIEGKAPSGHPVEWMEEESYFFKLSAFEDKLLALYEQDGFVAPTARKNEVAAFVKGGLKDISISRATFSWGVPVPNDDAHVMYVWVDALTNYITAAGYPDLEKLQTTAEGGAAWPGINLVGKDILRFHAVYWPAFLMAADLPVPQKVFAHGWWTVEGKKMSKSFGNVVDPDEVVTEFGADSIRFFLFREVAFGADGDFSRARLINRMNCELANDLGNLFQRVLSMVSKNCDGKVPAMHTLSELDIAFLEGASEALENARSHMDNLEIHKALDSIWRFVCSGNQYMDSVKPWELRKENPAQMAHVLRVLMEAFAHISVLLEAFMPEKSKQMQALIGFEDKTFADLTTEALLLQTGTSLPKPEGLFPRIEEEAE